MNSGRSLKKKNISRSRNGNYPSPGLPSFKSLCVMCLQTLFTSKSWFMSQSLWYLNQ